MAQHARQNGGARVKGRGCAVVLALALGGTLGILAGAAGLVAIL